MNTAIPYIAGFLSCGFIIVINPKLLKVMQVWQKEYLLSQKIKKEKKEKKKDGNSN